VHFSVGKIELLSLSAKEIQGDNAAWNYFQSLDHPTNRTFVETFLSRHAAGRGIA
jgi:urea transport system substrate-binding protein